MYSSVFAGYFAKIRYFRMRLKLPDPGTLGVIPASPVRTDSMAEESKQAEERDVSIKRFSPA